MAEVIGYRIELQADGMFHLFVETPRTTFLGRVLRRSDFRFLGRYPTQAQAVRAMRHHIFEGDGTPAPDVATYDERGRFIP